MNGGVSRVSDAFRNARSTLGVDGQRKDLAKAFYRNWNEAPPPKTYPPSDGDENFRWRLPPDIDQMVTIGCFVSPMEVYEC